MTILYDEEEDNEACSRFLHLARRFNRPDVGNVKLRYAFFSDKREEEEDPLYQTLTIVGQSRIALITLETRKILSVIAGNT